MGNLISASKLIQEFEGEGLGLRLSTIENSIRELSNADIQGFYKRNQIDLSLLSAALLLKKAAAQINVSIHAIGILLALPSILKENERIESLSLGAGNTGRSFDLETNLRVAEFKFIFWRGGAETIRQNSCFKDFYLMAETETTKEKYLYVIEKSYVLKFLRGGRSLSSVLSRHIRLEKEFRSNYPDLVRVNEYYELKKEQVSIIDLFDEIPELRKVFGILV